LMGGKPNDRSGDDVIALFGLRDGESGEDS
jgi:hypothetical protein